MGALTREALVMDWAKFHPRAALLRVVAMGLALMAGIVSHHPRQGLMATAGAFSVGFGSFQEMRGSRKAPMLWATLGMCLSSWVGTLAGPSPVATILVVTLAAVLYAGVSRVEPGASWVALQCVIWLAISSAFPATGLQVLTRGTMVLAGGLLQTALTLAVWHWEGAITPSAGPVAAPPGDESLLGVLKQALQRKSDDRLYLWQAAATMIAAAALDRWLAPSNGYWIPMTALLVMRPDMHQAVQRGFSRILGTLVGAGLSTLIAAGLRPGPHLLLALVLLFAWTCYAVIYVNYGLFTACVTAYVVFLLAVGGLPEMDVIAHRAVNTMTGGTLALFIHVPFAFVARKRDRNQHLQEADGA